MKQRPKAEVDNILRDLQNYSYPTKAEFNHCFVIHSKYFLVLTGVLPFQYLFFHSPSITQPCPQVFSVNGVIICSGLHFWRHFDVIGSTIFGGLHFWRHWFNIWLWWIMRVVLTSQKRGNIWNEIIINTSYATLSRCIPWNIPRITCVFTWHDEPLAVFSNFYGTVYSVVDTIFSLANVVWNSKGLIW